MAPHCHTHGLHIGQQGSELLGGAIHEDIVDVGDQGDGGEAAASNTFEEGVVVRVTAETKVILQNVGECVDPDVAGDIHTVEGAAHAPEVGLTVGRGSEALWEIVDELGRNLEIVSRCGRDGVPF